MTSTALLVTLWFACGGAIYLDARQREWPADAQPTPVGWGVVGVFAFLLAVPFYLHARRRTVPASRTPMRRCPHCPALMPVTAGICPTCGRGLNDPTYKAQAMMSQEGLSALQSGAAIGTTTVKICPDCAESVLPAARVCKHCGYRFDAPPPSG